MGSFTELGRDREPMIEWKTTTEPTATARLQRWLKEYKHSPWVSIWPDHIELWSGARKFSADITDTLDAAIHAALDAAGAEK